MSPSPWLSPEEYVRLSPTEKRRLWLERNHDRSVASNPRSRHLVGKRVHYWRQRLVKVLVILAVIPAAAFVADRLPVLPKVPVAPEQLVLTDDGEGGAFGYCLWGGGTNCVVDGDTFYIDGAKVRIAGIDAPETHPPNCAEESRLGDAATEKLQALLNSGRVTMTSIDRDRDVYGRLLRNVAVNGEDVGEAMISAGVARDYGSGRRGWC